MLGTVRWFDAKRGYGFIANPEGRDVFVHYSSIDGDGFRALREGEQVEYEQAQGAKGLFARQVKRLTPLPQKVAESGPGLPAH